MALLRLVKEDSLEEFEVKVLSCNQCNELFTTLIKQNTFTLMVN